MTSTPRLGRPTVAAQRMERRAYLALSAASFMAVAVAHALQIRWSLEPCSLCILQRYAFLGLGIVALLASIRPSVVARTILALTAGAGLAAAGKSLWVLHVPSITCGRDALSAWLNGLPTARWWPGVFEATGLCSAPIPDVLGFSFPLWAAAGFATALAVLAVILVHNRRTRGATDGSTT